MSMEIQIKAFQQDVQSDRKTFRICYNDGNKKWFEADNIYDALSFALFERGNNASDIWKIEEVFVQIFRSRLD